MKNLQRLLISILFTLFSNIALAQVPSLDCVGKDASGKKFYLVLEIKAARVIMNGKEIALEGYSKNGTKSWTVIYPENRKLRRTIFLSYSIDTNNYLTVINMTTLSQKELSRITLSCNKI